MKIRQTHLKKFRSRDTITKGNSRKWTLKFHSSSTNFWAGTSLIQDTVWSIWNPFDWWIHSQFKITVNGNPLCPSIVQFNRDARSIDLERAWEGESIAHRLSSAPDWRIPLVNRLNEYMVSTWMNKCTNCLLEGAIIWATIEEAPADSPNRTIRDGSPPRLKMWSLIQ